MENSTQGFDRKNIVKGFSMQVQHWKGFVLSRRCNARDVQYCEDFYRLQYGDTDK